MDAVQKQVNRYYERMEVSEEDTDILRQRAVAFYNQGDILLDQGNLQGALQAYQNGHAIAQKLVAADPSNTTWQIDLVVSFWKIGSSIDVTTEPDKQEAQDKLSRALDILRRLDEQGRLAPRYQQWISTIEQRLESLRTPGDRR